MLCISVSLFSFSSTDITPILATPSLGLIIIFELIFSLNLFISFKDFALMNFGCNWLILVSFNLVLSLYKQFSTDSIEFPSIPSSSTIFDANRTLE